MFEEIKKYDNSYIKILKLRIFVGYLGESSQYGWWSTRFYEPISSNFLEPVFQKTTFLTKYHGALEAARRIHDENLNVGCYHLFRFPEEIEQDFYQLLQQIEIQNQFGNTTDYAIIAKDGITYLAGEKKVTNVGPTLIGKISNIDKPEVVSALAACYETAFRLETRIYPYLVV